MKRAILAVLLWAAWAAPVRAEVIEGFTPSGRFVAVGVDEQGHLLISLSTVTTTAAAVTFIATQSVYAMQPSNSNPWQVDGSSVQVVAVGTAAVTTAALLLIPAIPDTRGSLICNEDTSTCLRIGPATVTPTIGLIVQPGSCGSLDGIGGRFNGAQYGAACASTIKVSSVRVSK